MNPNSGTPAMKMFMRSVSLISLPVTALMPSVKSYGIAYEITRLY